MTLKLTPLTGRTTFVNTLCGKDVLTHKDSDDASTAHVEDGVKIKPVTVGTYTFPNDHKPLLTVTRVGVGRGGHPHFSDHR